MPDTEGAFPSYRAEAWVRRIPGASGDASLRWAHAWCLPTKYVHLGWKKNGGIDVFDRDTCQYCDSSMMKEPYQ